MIAIVNFIFFIAQSLLTLLWWAIIIAAVISWLVAFDVINLRNPNAYNIANMFDRVTRPVMRPFQRIIPTLGGVDISPIIVLLCITGVKVFLLPALQGAIIGALGGGGAIRVVG
jgi:YggT family protein